MSVYSQPIKSDGSPPRKPQIGLVSAGTIERWFLRLIYAVVFLLALLSILGTFYGLQGRPADVTPPWQMAIDVWLAPMWIGAALAAQVVLSLVQWGARVKAKSEPRWWFLYLAVLGVSVYYNFVAFFDPVVALGMPPGIVLVFLVAGDALPELVVVQR